ncbi:hypothetical protein FKM82_026231, partial [Ascaphus truei]
ATVNNLQAKVDALEKSNTKLTEELAVANNRIITMQEEMERMKDESSYYSESSRKVSVGTVCCTMAGRTPDRFPWAQDYSFYRAPHLTPPQ